MFNLIRKVRFFLIPKSFRKSVFLKVGAMKFQSAKQLIFKNMSDAADKKTDLLSGLTVSLALVPEAVAFSFVAGVGPLVGLYAAFIVGLITGIFGGRPGMISGATGALAVVMVSLVSRHGIEYLFAAVVLMGIFQVLAGALRLGKFVRLIPHSVMLGGINGLAIVIFLAQFSQFKMVDATGVAHWLPWGQLGVMLGLMGLTMSVIFFLPKLTKAIPSALAGIVVVTVFVKILGIDTRSVADMASIKGGLPSFHFPFVPLNFEMLRIILPYSGILAAVGLTETLMTLQLVDEVTETRGRGNKECVAQGLANLCCGFFGAMGGCAMIGQSLINVNSGGRGRLSAIASSLFLLLFIVVGSTLIGMIPLAALVGVMFIVFLGAFEWSSLRILRKIPRADAFVLILVSVLTVLCDLAIAVISGVIVSALVFAWNKSKRIKCVSRVDERGIKHYVFKGPLFFGSVQSFLSCFDTKGDPEVVMMDFKESRVCDHSAIEAINTTIEKYRAQEKKVFVNNLSRECASAVKKVGLSF